MPPVTIPKRPSRRRDPALLTTPVGQWNPDAVGVRGYPKTQEAYDIHRERLRKNANAARAAGKMTRRGIPNGFRGRRQEVEQLRAEAADEGWKIAQAVCRNSATPEQMLEVANAPRGTSDEARAAFALAGILAIAVDPTLLVTVRLKAFRIALSFLVPLPRGKVRIELDAGVAWLRSLSREAAQEV